MLGTWFIAPAAGVGALTALHFLSQGVLGDFLQFTVFNHFVGMSSYEYPTFPSLLPLFRQDPELRSIVSMGAYSPAIVNTIELGTLLESRFFRETALYDTALKLFYYGPYLVFPLALVRLWRTRSCLRSERRRAYLSELVLSGLAMALLLMVTLNRPQDYVHLVVLYWPLLCLGLVYLHALLARRAVLAWSVAALAAYPLVVSVGYTAHLAHQLRELHSAPIASPRAGIRVKPREARILDELVAHLQERSRPDEPVAIMPYFPLLHFLAERPGPHRSSYIVWPFPELPDRDAQVIGALERQETEVLVYLLNEFGVFEGMRAYAPEIYEYLVENYETERIFNYEILSYRIAAARRRPPRREGRPLSLEDGGTHASERWPLLPPRPLARDEWRGTVARDLWPFRRVVALRPTLDGSTVLSIPVTPRAGERLRSAVAIHPDRWDQRDDVTVRFEVSVVDGQRRDVVYAKALRPTPDLADRGWFPVDVSLERWAGRPVRIELSTSTDEPAGQELLMGGFEEPRLVRAASADPGMFEARVDEEEPG